MKQKLLQKLQSYRLVHLLKFNYYSHFTALWT